MAYDPKWIRDEDAVKRDGTNDLTGDWDIGDARKILLDELRIRDTSGLTVTDTTGNVVANMTNDGLLSLANGVGVNEFSTDTSLTQNSDTVIPTQSAIKSYVDTSIAGFSTTPESLFFAEDSTAVRLTALLDGIEITNGTTPVKIEPYDNSVQGVLTGLRVYDKNEAYSAFIGINYANGNTAFRSMTPGAVAALQGYKDSTSSYVTFVYGYPGASTILRYDNVDKLKTLDNGVEILGGITLDLGEHVDEISNDPLTDSTSALLTAEAIDNKITTGLENAYVHTQSVDSTTWIVTHNLGTQYVNVEVIKNDNTTIIPTTITFDSASQLTITLPIALSGYVAVTSGGGKPGNSLSDWISKSGAYTASNGDRIVVYTSGGAVTITLPLAPSFGDQVEIIDGDINFTTNNCTIGRNSANIDGNAGDYVLDTDKADVRLVYTNVTTGWRVING